MHHKRSIGGRWCHVSARTRAAAVASQLRQIRSDRRTEGMADNHVKRGQHVQMGQLEHVCYFLHYVGPAGRVQLNTRAMTDGRRNG